MPEPVVLTVNGAQVAVPAGATVAVAVALVGSACRRSVSGQPRGPVCGMGICFECCVTIDGKLHCRSCQVVCRSGMEVSADE
jgi:D-hydroxyproline dehydrogenase subunit gamma